MDGISALASKIWQQLAGWLGKGNGSTWILAGSLAFAGGSSALLGAAPARSTVVQVRTNTAQRATFSLATYAPHHHCDGAGEGGY